MCLLQASLTTNASFDILRTYENDVPSIKDLLRDYASTVTTLFSQMIGSPFKEFVSTYEGHGTYVNKILVLEEELSNLTFANPLYVLKYHRNHSVKVVNGQVVEIYMDRNIFGKHDPSGNRASMTFSKQLQEDRAILASYICDIYTYQKPEGLLCDHFTLQWTLGLNSGNKPWTLSQVYGAQLYLDIHHVLRDSITTCYQDLKSASERIQQSIALCKRDSPDKLFIKDKVMEVAQHNLDALEYQVACFVQDRDLYRKARDHLKTHPMPLDMSKYSPLERSPLLCGIYMFQVIFASREVGALISAVWKSIKSAGQLYYAFHLHRDLVLGLIPRPSIFHCSEGDESTSAQSWTVNPLQWDTMEYILDTYKKEHLFQGFLPKSNFELFRHHVYFDEIHTKAENKAKSSPYRPLLQPPNKSEIVDNLDMGMAFLDYKPISISHRLYFSKYQDRFKEVEANIFWTQDNLKALLDAHAESLAVGDKEEVIKEKKSRTLPIVSQVRLLQTMQSILQSESKALDFDFLSFHVECLNLLRVLQHHLCTQVTLEVRSI